MVQNYKPLFFTIMYTLFNKKFLSLLVVSALFVFAACDNPTSSDDDHDEHSDPFGVALIMNGVEIAAQENGVVTYNEGNHMELGIGEETDLITIRWIAEDGDRFVPETDEGYGLKWIVDNENVLEVEQHEEDGAWSFHLVGLSAGESEVNFQLWHNDHADFTSSPFEVHVEQVVNSMEVRDGSGNSIVTVDAEGNVTGSIDLNTDETAGPFTAVFLDEDGNMVDTDHDYELELHVETGSEFVSIERTTEDPFSFNVTGVSQGSAEIHFELIVEHGDHDDDHDHGDEDDHGDEIIAFESPDITINVN